MSKRSILLAALAAAALAAPVLAQQPAPTAGTSAAGSGPAGDWTLQPALVKHVAPRGPELAAAGIKSIAARTGRQRRDIQVVSQFGPAYFAWPKGAAPAIFEIEVEAANNVEVWTTGYTPADEARYRAAIDAVIPEAVRAAARVREQATRPKGGR
jgi:hypothetical protein